jgi:hypothetical protein
MVYTLIILAILAGIGIFLIGMAIGHSRAMSDVRRAKELEGIEIVGRCYMCAYPLGKDEVFYGDDGVYLCPACNGVAKESNGFRDFG